MKLLVKDLWLRGEPLDYASGLFRVPQMGKIFDGYEYSGQMRPRGIKWGENSWKPLAILEKLPDPESDVYLVLTSRHLFDENGMSFGVSDHDGKCLVTTYENVAGTYYPPDNAFFINSAMEEIGHSLGLQTHHMNENFPCVMQGHKRRTYDFPTIEEVRFCTDCYEAIQTR